MNKGEIASFNEQDFMEILIGLCDDLAWGRSACPDKLYALTHPDAGSGRLVRLAEAFGLMLVKLEGREYENSRLVEQLIARNEELEKAHAELAERHETLLRAEQSAASIENVVAHCEEMRHVVEMALIIARRPINTLILGPTGAGKEVLAKLIHNHSPRRDGPFVAVNCTAIPDSLFESEMFGIEKGVATGVAARKGLVEEANGGTLFLDELAEMALPNQAKLLRVLEEREVQRVGSARPVPVDINLVAATHVPLLQAVREGRFREDLYYRINVVEILLPPLHQRGDDVLLLAQLFLDRHSQRLGRARMTLAPDACVALQVYTWPGNVRELNNEMERTAALCPREVVDIVDLSPRLRAYVQDKVESSVANQMPPKLETLCLEEMEKLCVERALERTKGNRSRAAELLGLTREGLRKKLLRMNAGTV